MRNYLLLPLLLLFSSVFGSTHNILDYGALPGQLSTEAIQKAVDACAESGGGTVLVPSGRFITGTIILKSHVNLHLEQGAILEGSKDIEDYTSSFKKHGMIFCIDATHVSLTGKGIIDAQGTFFYDTTKNHVYEEFNKQMTRQKDNYMPDGTFFTDGPIKRIQMPGMTITFYHCSKVVIEDITIRDTPIWATRFAYCDDLQIHGISIYNNLMIPNSDGVHCTASRNIRMSDCDIRAGDDAFIVTGFDIVEDRPGYSMEEQNKHKYGNKSIFSENITVSNCTFQSRSAGIRIGYGQHPIRRCVFDNIVIYNSNRGIGIFAHDEADIEDLIFSNVIIQTRLHNGQWWGNGEPIHLSSISRFEGEPAGKIINVQFNNIIATSEHGILIYGDEENAVEHISLNNINLTIVKGNETMDYGGNFDLRPTAEKNKQLFKHDIPGIYASHVNHLSINDFDLNWGENLPDFFTHGIECLNVSNLEIDNFYGIANPNSKDGKSINLVNSTLKSTNK